MEYAENGPAGLIEKNYLPLPISPEISGRLDVMEIFI